MRKILITFLTLLLCSHFLFSQKAIIMGQVIEYESKESLVGVNIIVNSISGTISDNNGKFSIEVEPGKIDLEIRYIGYKTEKRQLNLLPGEKRIINFSIQPESKILDEVVISAGKFEQKISDISISMEVVKLKSLERNNILNVENAIEKVSGVMIVDKQASIRGGSGYSFGAGSRVLLMVDDLPLVTGASGEAIWEFVPVENIEQIEVVKGASSSLFGSSALNGVINIRTAFAKAKPETRLLVSSGFYGSPNRNEIKWWGSNIQQINGMQFRHSRKIKNFELVVGGSYGKDEGYRENDNDEKYRVFLNTRISPKKIKGLNFGINTTYMNKEANNFLLWKDGDSGVYRISPSFVQSYTVSRFVVDPFITYYNNKSTKHSLRARYYGVNNQNNTNQSNKDFLYYTDYKLQYFLKKNTVLTSGATFSIIKSESELYGNYLHTGNTIGIYSQLDKKFEKLSISIGGRWEQNKIDKYKQKAKPVFRSGLNYKITKSTFLRASMGQGFRYPSIAELYTLTQVGSLKVFPNPDLISESGWNAELGIIQGFKTKNFKGYFDCAFFWTEYKNMMEFSFGVNNPDSIIIDLNPKSEGYLINWVGFKAINAENARIQGVEINGVGEGYFGKIKTTISLGYTFINPLSLNPDPVYIKTFSDSMSRILKYRSKHLAKFNLDLEYKGILLGCNVNYFSKIINIDKVFEELIIEYKTFKINLYDYLLPGLPQYRQEHNNGAIVFDFRLGYSIKEKHQFVIIAKNALNNEYMIRPGDVQPPTTYTAQYTLKF